MTATGQECVTIKIIDDDVPEPDESFIILLSEVEPGSSAECNGSGGGGMSGSGISEGPSHNLTNMLQPMVANATAVITIRDDDLMTTSTLTESKVPTKTPDMNTNEDDETANGDDRVGES